MSELKKPNKILVVRYYVKEYSNGEPNLICHGRPLNADNKELKKFTNAYDSAVNLRVNSGIRMADYEFDNEPISGYQFVYPVYGTLNTEYYIMHPEGFRFMITPMKYRDLVNSCTVDHGKILDELFFDSNMNLINPNTEEYKKLLKEQKKLEDSKQQSSNLTVGCTLIHKNDNTRLIYCGKLHFLSNASLAYLSLKKSSSLHHVFLNEQSGKYSATLDAVSNQYTVSTSVLKKIDEDLVLAECTTQMNNKIDFHNYSFFSSSVDPILITKKKITSNKNLEFVYTDVDKSHFIKTEISQFSPAKVKLTIEYGQVYICEHDGQTYRILGFGSEVQTWRNSSSHEVRESHNYVENYNYSIWGYPVTLSENGVIQWDVDISKHRSLTWNSAFSHKATKNLHTMTKIGYLNNSNIQLKHGQPKELK